ncbi:hypothetical protein LWC33_18495 [Pseudonocardia sp. RS11V-5]|uniref:hypothetical protein n=1 Tax=Pseudonocardia terrae TaxID=2905831 RepID=UPI001E2AA373|nr:hypothetical protein [Pseudonocardia terrae]MCE3553438.1 hypothetical protein [Pseudonocardia terrae]
MTLALIMSAASSMIIASGTGVLVGQLLRDARADHERASGVIVSSGTGALAGEPQRDARNDHGREVSA